MPYGLFLYRLFVKLSTST